MKYPGLKTYGKSVGEATVDKRTNDERRETHQAIHESGDRPFCVSRKVESITESPYF
jgi:hypothetical protein